MDTPANPSIGFVGWNPFQFLHFSRLIDEFPNAELVLEERRKAATSYDLDQLPCAQLPVVRLDRKGMHGLDGRFDILVCQTVFAGIEDIRSSKIAMLQYGYAKEAHNYGAWRAFGDLCLTFGPYASRKIEPFCHSVAVGNPRYEDWEDPSFRHRAGERHARGLDPDRKTILYAPTWGPLSSYDAFADAVASLTSEFNVILKIHHITQRDGAGVMDRIRHKFPRLAAADDDIVELLSVADVMISDYSGAIFDAVYCRTPLVLLDTPGAENQEESRSDPHSLERARRHDLGQVMASAADLTNAVRRALASGPVSDALRDDLFVDSHGAARRAAEAIRDLAAGRYQQTQHQAYIRQELRAHHCCKSELHARLFLPGILRKLFHPRES